MMRVTVVANCQGVGIEAALKAMNAGFVTRYVLITEIQNGETDLNDIFDQSEYVLAQKSAVPVAPAGGEHKLVYFPTIAFDGYHPDITFVRGRRKDTGVVEAITSEMVIYHSAIALFGYINDFSVDQTLSYFNHYVMDRLGYFDRWENARDELLAEGESVGMPLSAEFHAWAAQGCFMYSNNHPKLDVIVDIARRLMQRMNVPIVNHNVQAYLADTLKTMPVWPVYPWIATRFGFAGDFAFKRHDPNGVMTLREFVELSYAAYDHYEKESFESLITPISEIDALLKAPPPTISAENPYKKIDSRQFWRQSVASIEPEDLDPVLSTKFVIKKRDKVATAGSCFAQNIARTLKATGFNYFVSEQAPHGISAEEAHARNFGVYSARYGNIYTVRQLVQLIERVQGRFIPDEQYWLRKDGRLVDPFRPQIEADGFGDLSDLTESREKHFSAVRDMFENMDVFVFTLGLTEGWRSKVDGAVFPIAPGVSGGSMDPTRYEFVNFTTAEVTADMFRVIDLIKEINPTCRIILTVSPVPLIATYENKHALVSTTYSKSVLRVAANEVSNYHSHVDYFSSYEIITGSYNRGAYYMDDLREVTQEGVSHVMRVFMKNYAATDEKSDKKVALNSKVNKPKSRNLFDIVCDEEAIARF